MFNLKFDLEAAIQHLDIQSEEFFTKRFLEDFGNACLYYIIQEAKADLAKQGNKPTPKGKPEGIPDDPKFFESFGFDILPDNTIEIYSTWEWIDQIMEGRRAYPMKWLTKPEVKRVPFGKKKTPVIRSTPDSREAWIHPGFKSHDFIQRGVERALSKFGPNLGNQVRRIYTKKPPR